MIRFRHPNNQTPIYTLETDALPMQILHQMILFMAPCFVINQDLQHLSSPRGPEPRALTPAVKDNPVRQFARLPDQALLWQDYLIEPVSYKYAVTEAPSCCRTIAPKSPRHADCGAESTACPRDVDYLIGWADRDPSRILLRLAESVPMGWTDSVSSMGLAPRRTEMQLGINERFSRQICPPGGGGERGRGSFVRSGEFMQIRMRMQ